MSTKEEEKKDEDAGERDLSDLLYDFGDNLKSTTMNRGGSTQRQIGGKLSLTHESSSIMARK